MDSREIVRRTLEFDHPERIAASFPSPYWNDLGHTNYELPGFARDWQTDPSGRQEYTDEWGNKWGRVDATSKGEVVQGALEDWDAFDQIQLPDLADPSHFDRVRRACADPLNTKWRIGGLPGFPFNIARKMRRLDEFFVDLIARPEQVAELLALIEDLLSRTIVEYAHAGVDSVMFPEDWGTQESLMISPRMWRRVFKPSFVRLCSIAHESGIKVFMHSCGRITAIIPDLVEAGIDLLQFDQPTLHGIANLAAFHGDITFWCPVDIQKTLQTHDPDLIKADARAMVETIGGRDGGFIGGYYGDNASIGLDPQWQDIACRAFTEYGDYRNR